MKKPDSNINFAVKRIIIIGSIINIFLSAAKIVAGYLFLSSALIADDIHSLSDLITDIAVLFGIKFWSKAPDSDHPYGHG